MYFIIVFITQHMKMVLVNEGKCGCMYVEMMTLLRWKEEIGQAQ